MCKQTIVLKLFYTLEKLKIIIINVKHIYTYIFLTKSLKKNDANPDQPCIMKFVINNKKIQKYLYSI